jgi:hypothetical protein
MSHGYSVALQKLLGNLEAIIHASPCLSKLFLLGLYGEELNYEPKFREVAYGTKAWFFFETLKP